MIFRLVPSQVVRIRRDSDHHRVTVIVTATVTVTPLAAARRRLDDH